MDSRTQALLSDSLVPSSPLSPPATTTNADSTVLQIVSTNRSGEREHLVIPGTIIHLYSINRVGLFSRRSYRACMSTYDQFSQFIVHPRMWLDHFPASYSTALTDVVENSDQNLHEIT
jgi:hypothetical protein